MKKITIKEKSEKMQKVKQGFLVASLWLTHIITIVLLAFSYMLLPTFYGLVTANAWAVLIAIIIIPVALLFAAGSAIFVVADLIKSSMSKKWWHIVIACLEFAFLIVTVLTIFGVLPAINFN
ncbi:MAG: hypothetical protein IJ542_02615 [Clostridia bacterium]|nr:hypothetical protein [Clostridia bacterium]